MTWIWYSIVTEAIVVERPLGLLLASGMSRSVRLGFRAPMSIMNAIIDPLGGSNRPGRRFEALFVLFFALDCASAYFLPPVAEEAVLLAASQGYLAETSYFLAKALAFEGTFFITGTIFLPWWMQADLLIRHNEALGAADGLTPNATPIGSV